VQLDTMRAAYQRQLQALHAQVVSLQDACDSPGGRNPLLPSSHVGSLQLPGAPNVTPGDPSTAASGMFPANGESCAPLSLPPHHPPMSCELGLFSPRSPDNFLQSGAVSTREQAALASSVFAYMETPPCGSNSRQPNINSINADRSPSPSQSPAVFPDQVGARNTKQGFPSCGSPAAVTVPTTTAQQGPFSGHLGQVCTGLGAQPTSAATSWATARLVRSFAV
jgi:hypothetical protein